jgi:hypothetical protein
MLGTFYFLGTFLSSADCTDLKCPPLTTNDHQKTSSFLRCHAAIYTAGMAEPKVYQFSTHIGEP